jgi:hypothetical protein
MSNNKQRSSRRFFSSELFFGILLVTGYLIYHAIKTQRDNNWTQARIEKKFSKNLVMVKHDYVIKIVFQDRVSEPFYIVKNDTGNYEQWKKGSKPNTVYGCGFITNEKGDCITSRKISNPLPEKWEVVGLEREAGLIREMFDINSKATYEIFTVSIGYYPYGASAENTTSFFQCKSAGHFDSGIAELKGEKPAKPGKKLTEFKRVQYRNQVEKGHAVFVLGLPLDMNSNEPVQVVSGQTKLDSFSRVPGSTKDWRELHFRLPAFFMFEGAPVFNRKGNIIGVMTAGTNGYKAFLTLLER